MSFIKITQDLLNETITENGDKAFNSTLSPCLNYFALIGGKRNHISDCASLFAKAYFEDKLTALKLLFFTRDIRNGLGERRIFRFLFNSLAISYPDDAIKLIPYIPQYGRYDDLLCLLGTPVEGVVIDLIAAQLDEDLKNKKEGKPISLLAKWLPSINTSNQEARNYARYLAEKLNLTKEEYRKTLSYLRKGLILENNLREKDYSFDYGKIPSVAMSKYRHAFYKNDQERFEAYIQGVQSGEKTMNVGVLDVVTLIKRARQAIYSHNEPEEYFDATWKELVNEGELNHRTLVVRDGSGSMYSSYYSSNSPIDIANALTMLTAARIQGEFHDKFITFSSKPELVDLSDKEGIFNKLRYLETFDDISNTNIEAVYNLILNVYRSPDFKKEDAIEQILIISDMQFDSLTSDRHYTNSKQVNLMSTFEYFTKEFENIGYQRPEIIFWNADARNDTVPVTKNEYGVKLISGSSKNVIDTVINTASIDPLDFMNKVLQAYNFIDKLFIEEK